MKYLTFFVIILFMGCNANNNSQTNDSIMTHFADTTIMGRAVVNPLVDTEKRLLDSSTALVANSIQGKIKPSYSNEKVKPIMKKYFELFKKLSPADSLIVYNYRIEQLNDLVDLQVKKNKANGN